MYNSKIEHAALILRWLDYIYILLVVFLDRVFQQERFNRLLGFLATLIKMVELKENVIYVLVCLKYRHTDAGQI